jgi:hypothetical protein
MPVATLSSEDVIERLQAHTLPGNDVNAFYSSHLGGIVTVRTSRRPALSPPCQAD